MPAEQRGTVIKHRTVWMARYFDHDGVRKSKSGFATKTAARKWLDGVLDEVSAVRSGEVAPPSERVATVDALLDAFLEKHGRTIDPATKRKLTTQLKHGRASFGTQNPDTLRRAHLEDWQAELPDGNRHDCFRAFRQALAWGVARGLLTRDASVGIKNPKRRQAERADVHPFEDWTEVEAVAAELDARYRAIPILAAGTGLRPEEWIGLHRADVERTAGVVHVRRRYTGGLLKPGTKTGAERVVPLRQKVVEALEAMPARIDTPILFPAPRGGYIDLEKFRHREWVPALRGSGIDHRRVYDLRHTFATWAISDGVPTLTLAKLMGTSVGQLEDTYVRWLRRDAENLRGIFDAADARVASG